MKTLVWLSAGVGLGLAAYLIFNAPTPQYATGSEDVEDAAGSAAGWGTRQSASGVGNNVLGRVKEGLGNLTGNDRLANEGLGDQVAGSAQQTVGKFAQAAGQTLHDLNR
ncbi:MAG TPA: CsbD family protein [Acidobacteriaceae bacterium]|jgi:uncharacterized protein YjbJ (UPF0337 family)|nr:CsbD family protein [Acidobacteriaceae bacterium]